MRSEWNAKWVAVVLFLAGLVLSGLAGLWQLHRNSATAQAQFGVIADGVVAQIVSRMQTYEYGLRGTRGAALAVGVADIGVERFRRFGESRDIDREFPGARGLGFIRRVTPENEADFLAAARRERGAAFTIRQFRPREGERYVIQYIEPELRNAAAVGLDIASQSHLRLAADAAAASGNATLSSVVTLVQTSGEPMRSLLLLLPVYRPAAPQATSKARQAATLGWTYAPLEISEMLKTFYARDQEFALLLYDVGGGSAPERLFASAAADAPAAGGLFKRVRLPLYGRQWEFELRARPAFVERLNLGGLGPVLAGGLLISALMAAGLYAYLLNAPRAKRLRASQARWSAIAERAHDAIIGHTPEGVVTDWNGGAECLFGVPAQDAIGQALPSLIWPAEAPTSDADTTARVARGEAVPPYDAACQRRDGSLVHVSISASPIKDQNGSITGVAKILRNIDDHQRAKQRLLEANAALENTVLERTALLESAQRDLQHAQTEAQSALSQEKVPRAYKGSVRDYFDDLKK